MKYIFFDLDGTLVNSEKGIKAAFRHTFDRLAIPCPDDKILSSFIGPPLESSFANLVDPDQINTALTIFRDYYKKKGVYEVELYPGIEELLEKLKNQGYFIYITTSKNQPMAEKMLDFLNISHYFHGIFGALPDSYHKADVLSRALLSCQADLQISVIIGDTSFDMVGGKTVGISCIGVTWGFGSPEELLQSGADRLAETPTQLVNLLSTF